MKRSLWGWLAVCTMVAAALAAVPPVVNYQGYLTATDGSPLDTTLDITFRLYDDSWGGTPLWDEIHTATVIHGNFEAVLGSADPLSDALFEDGTVWLGVQIGSNSEMTPLIQFTTVPYAFRVETVDGATGGIISGKINIGTDNTNAGQYAYVIGRNNHASGDYSTVIAGGVSETALSNTASGDYSTISGGYGHTASGSSTVIGGGYSNSASNTYAVVDGGLQNDAAGYTSTVGGGQWNGATGYSATVAGGSGNIASGQYSSVGGGINNHARGLYSTVSGGGSETATDSNSAIGNYSVIGGGFHNIASNDVATIAGGYYHTASGNSATVGGGYRNTASNYYSTVGGGTNNGAMGQCATVGGGRYDSTWGNYSTVSGGYQNFASGGYSVIPGGNYNYVSGNYSFAAGRRAKAYHDGCFRWADATNADFVAPADSANSFSIRASGGIYLYTNTALTAGVGVWAGGGSWYSISDSTKKRNIRPVNTKEVLEKIVTLPITLWSYKSQDPSVEHIGPMAQDFWRLFHIGDDSLSISTIDPDGIALAAIQELAKRNEKLEIRNEKLEAEISILRTQVQSLMAEMKHAYREK